MLSSNFDANAKWHNLLGKVTPLIATVRVPHLLKSNTPAITTKTTILRMSGIKDIYRNILSQPDSIMPACRRRNCDVMGGMDESGRRKNAICYENIPPTSSEHSASMQPISASFIFFHQQGRISLCPTTQQYDNADTKAGITRRECWWT
jgi:hypothetical protein